ncbi:unnamed protein product, partial [Effrenium voratum]
ASSSKAKPKKRKPKASAKGAPKPKAAAKDATEVKKKKVLKEIANASAEAGQWENKLKESNVPNPEGQSLTSCLLGDITVTLDRMKAMRDELEKLQGEKAEAMLLSVSELLETYKAAVKACKKHI